MPKARILVVEDETTIAMELQDRLLDLGYDVPEPLVSGEEALAAVERQRPDLVLMDVRIRGRFDGIEVAERIRASHDVPVVYLTAYADRSTLERAKVTAPCGYLLKPFDDRLLEITVETALLRSRLARERSRWEAQRTEFIRRILEAQEKERRRIGRELHDALGQSLTSTLVKLGSLAEALARPLGGIEGGNESEASRELLAETRGELAAVLEEVRRLARGLHPQVLESLGFATALERLVEELERTHGIETDFHVRGFETPAERLPAEVETSLYRIAQEALNNVARHSRARSASVVAERTPTSLSLIVEDDGVGLPEGADVETRGLGLYGIHERVALLGGTFTLESPSGGGTALFIRLPLPPKAGSGGESAA